MITKIENYGILIKKTLYLFPEYYYITLQSSTVCVTSVIYVYIIAYQHQYN